MSLPGPLLLITDRTLSRQPLWDVVASAGAAGCRWVLVREKDLSPAQLAAVVQELMAATEHAGVLFSVSSDPTVAIRCGAFGVHLSKDRSVAEARRIGGLHLCIGVSAHSWEEARRAADEGADYITLSPIFLTASKPGYGPALGLTILRQISTALPIPVVALGGVTAQNARGCLCAGAAAVAIMGEIMRAEQPGIATATILRSIQG